MNIARFSVKNPVFANLLLMVMLVGGAISYHAMPREVFPEVPLDMIIVTSEYVGAPPEEVEKLITIPIENALEAVENIEYISSQSYENISVVEVKIQQGTKDVRKMIDAIKDELAQVENFPDDVKEPRVILIESEIPVINVAVAGAAPETVRREAAKELKRRLMMIKGVARIQTSGERDLEIWAEVDPFRMSALGISIDKVVSAISSANANLPAGEISSGRHQFSLRTSDEIKTVEDVSDVVIFRDNAGRSVKVGDIAEVSEQFEGRQTAGRVDGDDAITMYVMKSRTGSTIEIANGVREELERFGKELPGSIELKLSQDSSRYIKQRLKTLYTSGGIGLFMVCLVLFFFLNWRMAFWTALGIPASFAGAILVMDSIGITINMMTLFSLILVLGMVVDDAIIVTENVFRYLQLGYSSAKAAVVGTQQVFWPIIAATATTMAAFLPMLLMDGVMGKFISTIPIVVSITLFASFVEAFLVLPSHLADYAKPYDRSAKSERDWFQSARRRYRTLIKILLRRRYRTLAVVLIVFAGTVYYAKTEMKFVLFHSKDLVGVVVEIEMPVGTSLEETGAALAKVEEIAKSLPEEDIKATVSTVGMHLDYDNGRSSFGSNLGQTLFESTEFDTPGRRNAIIVLEEIREKVKLLTGISSIEVKPHGGGPPVGRALEARVSGEEYKILREIVREVKKEIASIPGVKEIRDDFSHGKSEIRIKPAQDKLSLFGLSKRAVASAVRAGFDGEVAATVKRGRDNIDVRVMFAEPYRNDIDFITELSVPLPLEEGQVRLSSVAELEWKEGFATINRYNRQRTIKVFADVDKKIITSSELAEIVSKRFENLSKEFPGYSLGFGGEKEEQEKSIKSLIDASILGLMIIYLILGTLFKSFLQPFVVIAAIPFSFIGVVLGHEIMGEPIGFLSLIGLAALTGIVVNDSLVMVDFINNARRGGASRWLSILRSAFVRFRAVILTSLTTILGLSTLAFKTTGQAAFLAPMAISIVFGLVFSTVLTLMVIPCSYAVLDDIMLFLYGKRGVEGREDDTV